MRKRTLGVVVALVLVGSVTVVLIGVETGPTWAARHPSWHPSWWPSPAHSARIASDGTPRDARLTIPRIGLHRLRVVRTRWVDFRSAHALRRQRAAVPGHPGVRARRGYLTLSTCATPEDHARGDFWADRFGNPRHRIDKIAVLVRREAR